MSTSILIVGKLSLTPSSTVRTMGLIVERCACGVEVWG